MDSFEDTCEVYRMVGEDEFSSGTKEVVYSGCCDLYTASYIRTFKENGVVKRDYAIDIPGRQSGIKVGMSVDVTYGDSVIEGCIVTGVEVSRYGTRYGTTLYMNIAEN